MQAKVLCVKEWKKPRDADIKRYAKYLLEEGSLEGKWEWTGLFGEQNSLTQKEDRVGLEILDRRQFGLF